MSAPVLSVSLPGLYSWSRPRQRRGRMGYQGRYVAGRDLWRLKVQEAVRDAGWTKPDVKLQLRTDIAIVAGGKWDADRVITAILDALQGGGAIVDDCRVKGGSWATWAPEKGEPERVEVVLSEDRRVRLADAPPIPWREIAG